MSNSVIVSRHPAAIRFITNQLAGEWWFAVVETDHVRLCPREAAYGAEGPLAEEVIPVIRGNATEADVRGKDVYGNIPMHLAAVAKSVRVVEFTSSPPRGQEYSLADMDAAGARLVTYHVSKDTVPVTVCILVPCPGDDSAATAENVHVFEGHLTPDETATLLAPVALAELNPVSVSAKPSWICFTYDPYPGDPGMGFKQSWAIIHKTV